VLGVGKNIERYYKHYYYIMKKTLLLLLFIFTVFDAGAIITDNNTAFAVAPGAEDGGCCGGGGNDGGGGGGGGGGNGGGGDGTPPPPVTPVCDLSINLTEVNNIGDAYRIEWNGGPSSAVFFINGTPVTDSGHANFTFTGPNYDRFKMVGNNGGVTCEDEVRITKRVVLTPTCESFSIAQSTVVPGANLTMSWGTTNATNVSINGIGPVAVDGVNQTFTAPNTDGTYTYRLTFDGRTNASCVDTVIVKTTVVQPPTPLCLSFTGSKTTITQGESITLNWNTANATQILINNAVGDVTDIVSKSKEVSPLADTTYNLTVIGATGTTPDTTCAVPVTVTPVVTPTTPAIDIIKRDAVDKDDTQTVVVGGIAQFEIVVKNTGNENLVNVVVTDPLESACNRTIGALAIGASETYTCNATNVQATFTNIANVTGNSAIDAEVVTDTDPTNVLIASTPVFTCANNVTFNASDTSITRGQSTTVNWSSTNVDSLTITGLNTTALSGNQTVAPSSDTTYILTATKAGFSPLSCPLRINVSTGGGGGGGGTRTPRCELEISDKNITLGEEITVKWETSNATEVTLKDDRGRVLFTTDEFLSRDKQQYFDHSIKFKPTRNTTYTLVAERGSRDRECEVSVKLDDTIVLLQVRDQAPLVSGISLTQVPYTGFEAGPVMTIMFYMLLVTWALYITYVLVLPKTQLAVVTSNTPATRSNVDLMTSAEQVRPDVFAAMAAPTMATVPANLPVAMPVVAEVVDTNTIENQAHALHALISSDAVRTIAGMTNEENQSDAVAKIVADAKGAFPLEDGWVIINQSRLLEITDATTPVALSAAPTGAGSLAEAIVTGNIVAAYQMIGTRPMVALADAAADLDALYRIRKGADAQVSDLLEIETTNLADEQIADMIAALTGALDGTYSDEAAAVKMAIMKAVKVAA